MGKAIVIAAPGRDVPVEIVGVVGHVAHQGLDTDSTSENQMYFPFLQVPDDFAVYIATGSTMLIRISANALGISKAVRDQVIGADRDQPVYNVRSMEQIVGSTLSYRRFTTVLLGLFAGLALLLATIGIYAVISYAVSERTREIGIRMALGARQDSILRMVVGHGMVTTMVGIGLGLGIAVALTRTMSTLLYGVKANDPLTHPMTTLREE